MLDPETKLLAILELLTSAQPDAQGNVPENVKAAARRISGSQASMSLDRDEEGRFVSSKPVESEVGIIATAEQAPVKVQVWREWDPLKSAMVGKPDHDVLPAWYPSFKDPHGNEVGGPETAGMTKLEFDPVMAKSAIKQTDALCELLEKEGVEVYRPPLIPLDVAKADPVGLSAAWCRECFTVIGKQVIDNQPRTPHRNKDWQAVAPFFAGCEVIAPPSTSFEMDKNWEADQRPFLEGGDIFRLGKNILVCMSFLASSGTGYRWLADTLCQLGFEVWPAYLTEEWEHGDYIFSPVREGLCIAYLPGFRDGLLPSPVMDWDCITVTHEEADERFACNGLGLGNNKLILPAGNRRVARALEKKGVDVIEMELDDVIYWQGGPRCASSTLFREGDQPPGMGGDNITLGMVGDEWHGPKPPGDPNSWAPIQAGPRGGKRWKLNAGAARRKPDKSAEKSTAVAQTEQKPEVTPAAKTDQRYATDPVFKALSGSISFHAEAKRLKDATSKKWAELMRLEEETGDKSAQTKAARKAWMEVYDKQEEYKRKSTMQIERDRRALVQAMKLRASVDFQTDFYKGKRGLRAAMSGFLKWSLMGVGTLGGPLGQAAGFAIGTAVDYLMNRSKPFDPQGDEKTEIESARTFVNSVCNWQGKKPRLTVGKSEDGRAYFAGSSIMVGTKRGEDATASMVHEMGHVIEWFKPGVREKAIAFLEKRTKGRKPISLDGWGMKGEKGNPDDFGRHLDDVSAAYAGKVYKGFFGKIRSTEIVSVGLESLWRNPGAFMNDDPEFAAFILDVLRG